MGNILPKTNRRGRTAKKKSSRGATTNVRVLSRAAFFISRFTYSGSLSTLHRHNEQQIIPEPALDDENDKSPESRPTTNENVQPEPIIPAPTLPSGQVIDAKNTLRSYGPISSFVPSPVHMVSLVPMQNDEVVPSSQTRNDVAEPFAIAEPVVNHTPEDNTMPGSTPRTRKTRIVSEPPGRRAEDI
jgi:hypothetical protein